jgi:uncharacterized protein (DUF1697 family)
VAFLRAINTGNRRIKMVDLRSVYLDAGCGDVATHIATGNVIFGAPSPPPLHELERMFEERFGFHAEVFLRDAQVVRSILDRIPWDGTDIVIEVSFLEREPDTATARALESTAVPPEQLAVSGSEVFFLRGHGRGAETVHKESATVKTLGMKTTRRGLATIEAIVEKYLDE